MPYLCRGLLLLLALSIFLPLSTAAAPSGADLESATSPPPDSAKAMVLLDAQSGKLLAAHNEHERLPMASTTKIMTALIAIEELSPDHVVTVPREAVGIEGSSIYLYEGEQITVQTLLHALLLSSANDAAMALALEISGSIPAFAAKMNEKAHTLGLFDTHFTNPSGLHEEEHYTSASNLAFLAAAALSNEAFAKIVATRRYTAAQNGTDATRLFLNHNRLLRTFEGAIGVKTGFTKAAGRCLVSAAEREGLTLICVTLSCPDDWRDHTSLLDWGFSQYERVTLSPATFSLPVIGGSLESVVICAEAPLALTLPRQRGEISRTIELPRFLYGTFSSKTPVGKAIYRLNGVKIGEIPLVTTAASEASAPPRFWAKMKRFFQG